MNEINQLKIENERYKKALGTLLQTCSISLSDVHRIAGCALNPPPPVTLNELTAALKKLNDSAGRRVLQSIKFFSDESGHILDNEGDVINSFYSFREALDKLTNQ